MPQPVRLVVRDTPIDLLREGHGPPLLFLHGAGAGGRWLPFQARLAERFDVLAPSHPGHGGSPPAEWIEHVSDLAFHYLDLLDTLGLARVHLVGASFGGWIAAEVATMASHRLDSLVLIDPVGIKVEGWIYPFLFGMELPEIVATVFHDPMAALALAPPDMSIDTVALLYRQNTALARVGWNPYLYEGSPLLPAFYPPELLHILWPGPSAVSWLLTLHFPLAALAMYALARELASRAVITEHDVYLLTCRPQVPAWLNVDHPRVHVVHHAHIPVAEPVGSHAKLPRTGALHARTILFGPDRGVHAAILSIGALTRLPHSVHEPS